MPGSLLDTSEIRFQRRGILFVVSAPSGGGKTTLLNALRPAADFLYSVSCTTRAPRPGEVAGKDYHFLSKEEFEARVAGAEFLEYAHVHGQYYGTLLAPVQHHLASGRDVLIDVDTQGAAQIRGTEAVRASVVDVFIMPASLDLLRARLQRRGTESGEQIETRLRNAAIEMEFWRDYCYTIMTGTAEDDLRNFRTIMEAERHLSRRLFLA